MQQRIGSSAEQSKNLHRTIKEHADNGPWTKKMVLIKHEQVRCVYRSRS